MWLGLLSGIARVKEGQVHLIDRKVGLYDNNIYGVVPDNLGNLWLDSGRGIFCLTKQNVEDFVGKKVDHVTCRRYDDMESVDAADKTEIQERLGCKSNDGRIWFPSSKGVVVIDPAHILTNAISPPVHIDAIIANRINLAPEEHLVPAGAGELEMHYSALTFIAPQKTRFRHRLKGFDTDWVEAGSRKIAFYTNLKPGHYKFQVIAANADGVWNDTGDSWSVELRPHFYQTAWFYALCGAAFLGGVAGIYLIRVRRLEVKRIFLQEARDRLESEVKNRTSELATANVSLQNEVEERKRMQQEIERVHRMLVDSSRQAGMAEIATNVLHNVGNVLNSANVSCTTVFECVQKSSSANLAKIVALLREHENDLGEFVATDPRGKLIPTYLAQLSDRLLSEKTMTLKELESLRQNIEHIKEIVSMQQDYTTVSGVHEVMNIEELVEDSLRMNTDSAERHGLMTIREFGKVPPLNGDRHKIMQILINFLRNAKLACDESGRKDKVVTARIAQEAEWVKISILDNGVGIPRENLTRIFNHGFTTRKEGHGFGLHSGALAAKELGGKITVESAGPGLGACFTLELPITQPSTTLRPK